jgi:hypothetical protein
VGKARSLNGNRGFTKAESIIADRTIPQQAVRWFCREQVIGKNGTSAVCCDVDADFT